MEWFCSWNTKLPPNQIELEEKWFGRHSQGKRSHGTEGYSSSRPDASSSWFIYSVDIKTRQAVSYEPVAILQRQFWKISYGVSDRREGGKDYGKDRRCRVNNPAPDAGRIYNTPYSYSFSCFYFISFFDRLRNFSPGYKLYWKRETCWKRRHALYVNGRLAICKLQFIYI